MHLDTHSARALKGSLLRLRGMVCRQGAATSTLESHPGEVRPPAMWRVPRPSIWGGLLRWLGEGRTDQCERVRTIDAARSDCQRAMADLGTADASGLRLRVNTACSLRELWHLRTELFGLVARHLSQEEAERRLAKVNRHFPAGTRQLTKDVGPRHG